MPYVPVKGGELFVRTAGEGPALLVVHGGPDFDHTYLLPDLDRLAQAHRLVYYDQRGRGLSSNRIGLDDIDIDLYVEDLDAIRRHAGDGPVAILGHSWGGLLAMHYAVAYPERVSHLILLNPAPASFADPEAVSEYYRRDFGTTFKRPADAARLRLQWTREDILRGRALEDRLMRRIYACESFNLLPALARVRCPTLVIHGELDFIPLGCDERIRDAIPAARLVVLPESGHFSYIDAGDAVRAAVAGFVSARGSGTATCA